ncbi:MAG: GIY-YIG nuclease family protein [Phycisphaerales bacterium]
MSTPKRGFSVKTFLADGEAEGLQIIEHSQWIGRGVVIPRTKFAQHAHRAELDGAGIYILVGRSPSTGVERIYVGQTAHLRDKAEELRHKSFWNKLIALNADGQRLHRGHAEYIEARLIKLARELKTCEVDNPEVPRMPALSEPDMADADYFCDQLTLIMPVLGVNAFKAPPAMNAQPELRLSGKGVVANGYSVGGQFVVEEGSTATRQDAESCPGHILDLRRSLLERGVLTEDGKLYRFAQNFAFDSASQAATLVLAEISKGGAWKDLKGERAPAGLIDDDAYEGDEGGEEGRPGRARPLRTATELKPTRVAAATEA